jgi:hypothetical protein
LAATWFVAASARAGEKLSMQELVGRAMGAAVVKVRLARGRAPDTVELVKAIRGVPAGTAAGASWLGLCLPDRKSLRVWTVEHRRWPALSRWRRALARGHYTAVVTVAKFEDGVGPQCGVEAMQMLHTDLGPGLDVYQEQVVAELQRQGK